MAFAGLGCGLRIDNRGGHHTAAIYPRYAISDEKSLKEAGAKLTMPELAVTSHLRGREFERCRV
jgi:hypothetical protein